MMKQYENLTDAPNLHEGVIRVWYMQPNFFPLGIQGEIPRPEDLDTTHILLGSLRKDAGTLITAMLDELWIALQGENWSPNGEARSLIRSKGLQHTSMSIGDCFMLPNGDCWIAALGGFKKVDYEPYGEPLASGL